MESVQESSRCKQTTPSLWPTGLPERFPGRRPVSTGRWRWLCSCYRVLQLSALSSLIGSGRRRTGRDHLDRTASAPNEAHLVHTDATPTIAGVRTSPGSVGERSGQDRPIEGGDRQHTDTPIHTPTGLPGCPRRQQPRPGDPERAARARNGSGKRGRRTRHRHWQGQAEKPLCSAMQAG
jgi:hypothetical protein